MTSYLLFETKLGRLFEAFKSLDKKSLMAERKGIRTLLSLSIKNIRCSKD